MKFKLLRSGKCFLALFAAVTLPLAAGGKAVHAYEIVTEASAQPQGDPYRAVSTYNLGSGYLETSYVGSAYYVNPAASSYDGLASGANSVTGAGIDSTGNATWATSSASATTNQTYIDAGGTGTLTSTAYAAANLSTGTLGASVSGSGNYQGGVGYAEFKDVLHFTIQGASATTVTPVTVQFSLDGTVVASNINSSASVGWNSGFAQVINNYISDQGYLSVSIHENNATGNILTTDFQTATGWAQTNSDVSEDLTHFVFQGVYNLTGSSADVEIFGQLNVVGGWYTTADYSHTALYGFGAAGLPSGVTFTSDSGVFLTAAPVPEPSSVPEPATMLLLGTGLAGLVAVRRKKTA